MIHSHLIRLQVVQLAGWKVPGFSSGNIFIDETGQRKCYGTSDTSISLKTIDPTKVGQKTMHEMHFGFVHSE
jgi:hypothetical protein